MTDARRFDPQGPLPRGTVVLEASAGTGKTHTIAHLAARYIAEGVVRIDQLLLITFGRLASRELKDRVREVLNSQRTQWPSAEGRHRLELALADFDSATIATTHQFCQMALRRLGIAGDTDPHEEFAESISDLVQDVLDDFYVRKYARHSGPILVSRESMAEIAREAINQPGAEIVGLDDPSIVASTRAKLAFNAREEVVLRRRRAKIQMFDDLVSRTAAALADSEVGPVAREALRSAYTVVMVDEFQDTDPHQWDILRLAFHDAEPDGSSTAEDQDPAAQDQRALILIGDPKQAIYGFRGGDIHTYLSAADVAHSHLTLDVNHRSDQPVIDGIHEILGDLELGDPRIVVRRVMAREPGSKLSHGGQVRLRVVPPSVGKSVDDIRPRIAADVAEDVVRRLGSGVLYEGRPMTPGDIAVLVRTNSQATLVSEALKNIGVPSVLQGTTSVFGTKAALAWLRLLRAFENPWHVNIRDVGLTDFVGLTADELAERGDDLTEQLDILIRGWRDILVEGSVPQLFQAVLRERGMVARVLGFQGGERALTDLRHVAEELHAHQRESGVGIAGLYQWLGQQIRESERDTEQSSRSRRLETDSQAVQIITVHRSKGLGFPLVYVPFGWDQFFKKIPESILAHAADGRRVLDVRQSGQGWEELLPIFRDEDAGESLRLLYVAMTRARSELVLHWASSRNTPNSPLHRALCAKADGLTAPAVSNPASRHPKDLLADAGHIAMDEIPEKPEGLTWSPAIPATAALSAAPYDRAVDTRWVRTSYSGLTRFTHELPEGIRDDEPAFGDEAAGVQALSDQALGDQALGDGDAASPRLSPLSGLPAGAAFGTVVHSVLEHTDTTAEDLHAELLAKATRELLHSPIPGLTPEALADALVPVMGTSMGSLSGGVSLADIAPRDRLSELDFEFPMSVGVRESATLATLGDLLRLHLPADDPMADYPDHLEAVRLGSVALRGYLSGSIDGVLRLREPGGDRYLVVDYKTNRVGPDLADGGHLAANYTDQAMKRAMFEHNYPLQALIYCVALHRFLRWRLPGYDPATHLGGVGYLFLRGMNGDLQPNGEPYGVFRWNPPAELIVAASDAFSGGETR